MVANEEPPLFFTKHGLSTPTIQVSSVQATPSRTQQNH